MIKYILINKKKINILIKDLTINKPVDLEATDTNTSPTNKSQSCQ